MDLSMDIDGPSYAADVAHINTCLPERLHSSQLGKRSFTDYQRDLQRPLFSSTPIIPSRQEASPPSLKARMRKYNTRFARSPRARLGHDGICSEAADQRVNTVVGTREDGTYIHEAPAIRRRIRGYVVNAFNASLGLFARIWSIFGQRHIPPAVRQEIVAVETDTTGTKRRAVAGMSSPLPSSPPSAASSSPKISEPEPAAAEDMPGGFPEPSMAITPPDSRPGSAQETEKEEDQVEWTPDEDTFSDLSSLIPSNSELELHGIDPALVKRKPVTNKSSPQVMKDYDISRAGDPSSELERVGNGQQLQTTAGKSLQVQKNCYTSRGPGLSQSSRVERVGNGQQPQTTADRSPSSDSDQAGPPAPAAASASEPAPQPQGMYRRYPDWSGKKDLVGVLSYRHPRRDIKPSAPIADAQHARPIVHRSTFQPTPKLPANARPRKEVDPNRIHERETQRDREIDELIERARQVQIGPPEVQELKQSIRRKKFLEDVEVKEREKKAEEEAEGARLKAQAEQEAEQARRKAEQEARAAAEHAEWLQKQPLIRSLDPDWYDKVTRAMDTKDSRRTLASSVDGVELTRYDFGRILPTGPQDHESGRPAGWLNDEIVNAWFAGIVAQKKEQTGYKKGARNAPAYEAYNTGWYSNYKAKRSIEAIKTWSRRKGLQGGKLLEAQKIFFPINGGAHWSLLIFSPTARRIEYLDSFQNNPRPYFKIAREWLQMELGQLYHAEEWRESKVQSGLQDNMTDCGVFACLNGLAAAKSVPFDAVTAEGMKCARQMMAGVLLNGGFTGEWGL